MIEKRYGRTVKTYTDNCIHWQTMIKMNDGSNKITKSLYEDDLKRILAKHFSTDSERVEFSKYPDTTIKCWVTFCLTDDEYEAYKKGELFR